MGIKIKKKICNECEKEAYIFSKGRCKPCASKEYARTTEANKRAKIESSEEVGNYKPKPIAKFSKKKLKELAIYRPLRDKYMKEYPFCEYKGCMRKGEDLHHKKPRNLNLCNVDIFMSVCRLHHNWIHENHAKSVELGYL